MKRFFYILILLAIGFAIGFAYREILAEIEVRKRARNTQTAYATQPIIHNKSFVVVTYALDNEDLVEQNLLSILSQDYQDFRVVYIDDGLEKDPSFVEKYDLEGRVTYIRNEVSLGSVESLYRAVHGCKSNEIVVLLRNEERFAHNFVLERLNHYFADPDVWAASAEEVRLHSYEKVNESGLYHAFYAGLFNRIKLRDFLREGYFKQGDYEEVITPPLRELAGKHAYRIPEPLVVSPKEKGIGDTSREETYASLKKYPWHDFASDDEKIDIVVFSYNRPLQLFAFLESSEKHVTHLHRQFVIYRAGNDHYDQGYQKVKEAFPNAIYVRQSLENPYEDFAPIVQKMVFDRNISPARYVAFALDDNIIKDSINMQDAVKALKETGAYGFYFRLGSNLSSHSDERRIPVGEGINAWQFSEMEEEWGIPNSVDMTLFRKDEISPYFLCMKFHNPNILQALWNEHADLSQVGLYYERSKVVNLPLNIVMENEWVNEKVTNISTKDLLVFFNQGLKMDITPLDQMENCLVEIDFEPEFTKR